MTGERERLVEELRIQGARAADTLHEFNAVRDEWIASSGFRIVPEVDQQTYRVTYRAARGEEPPALLSVIAAEVAHAARRMRDHVRKAVDKSWVQAVDDDWPPMTTAWNLNREVDNWAKHTRLPLVVSTMTRGRVVVMDHQRSEVVDDLQAELVNGTAADGEVLAVLPAVPEQWRDTRYGAALASWFTLTFGDPIPVAAGLPVHDVLAGALREALELVEQIDQS